jgi:CRISPR/Cas system-associated exonuclease Cas4 (RecB family)
MGIKKEQKRKVDNVNIQVERLWEDKPFPPPPRPEHCLTGECSLIFR